MKSHLIFYHSPFHQTHHTLSLFSLCYILILIPYAMPMPSISIHSPLYHFFVIQTFRFPILLCNNHYTGILAEWGWQRPYATGLVEWRWLVVMMVERWHHFNNARWKKENGKIVYISNVYRFPCLSFHVISSKEMYPTRPIIYTKYIILCLPCFISWTWCFSWLWGYFLFSIDVVATQPTIPAKRKEEEENWK